MKVKVFIPLCLITFFVKGDAPIREQITETQIIVSKLSENLTAEEIDLAIKKINSLVARFEQESEVSGTESEDGSSEGDADESDVGDLEEDGMFLTFLLKCINQEESSPKEGLNEWGQAKPRLIPIINKAIKLLEEPSKKKAKREAL